MGVVTTVSATNQILTLSDKLCADCQSVYCNVPQYQVVPVLTALACCGSYGITMVTKRLSWQRYNRHGNAPGIRLLNEVVVIHEEYG